MDEPALRQLLADVAAGICSPDDAARRLRRLPYADLGFARVDHHRALRQGIPEAVYGPGKTPEQCAAIVVELLEEPGGPVLLTRADARQVAAATEAAGAAGHGRATVTGTGGPATVAWRPAGQATRPGRGWGPRRWRSLPSPMSAAGSQAGETTRPDRVLVLTAGTADLPVADECRAVLEALGFRPALVADCGVAGVHRLLASVDELAEADAVVVVAGMEGALASLVGGITPAPVVAVPTSVGYGAALEGVTALLSMLASCASGITVVGIDNGFGAACAVARLLP